MQYGSILLNVFVLDPKNVRGINENVTLSQTSQLKIPEFGGGFLQGVFYWLLKFSFCVKEETR